MPDFKRFLHPEAIKRISRLYLRTQHIVEGFLSGMHRSPYFGQSVEFLQHRQYALGDDLRHIDWKVWARQDRLCIKQFEEAPNMRVNLPVDVSSSMAYGEGHLNKYQYTATIATSLAFLILKHQDAVGCVTFDGKVRAKIQTLSKQTQLASIIESLNVNEPKNKSDLKNIFLQAAETYPRRGMMIVVSDLFGDVAATMKGLRLLRQRGMTSLYFMSWTMTSWNFDSQTQLVSKIWNPTRGLIAIPRHCVKVILKRSASFSMRCGASVQKMGSTTRW